LEEVSEKKKFKSSKVGNGKIIQLERELFYGKSRWDVYSIERGEKGMGEF